MELGLQRRKLLKQTVSLAGGWAGWSMLGATARAAEPDFADE